MNRLALLLVTCGLLAAEARPADDARPADEALRQELLKRVKEDQEVRGRMVALFRKKVEATTDEARKVIDNELEPLMKQGQEVDRKNTAWLKEVVDKHGWPGKTLVGKDGANAAWLLVQHADLDPDFQKKCLPLLAEAVKKGEAEAKHLAYLTDRVCVGEGKKQVYGTQMRTVDGKTEPAPIEDEANVDQRRKEVGLGPLADYLKLFQNPNDKPAPPKKPAEPGEKKKPDAAALKSAAKAFIERLAKGEFDQAARALDDEFGQRLTADKLRATWEGLVRHGGAFRGQEEPEIQSRPTGEAAYVPCDFGGKKSIARMLFNDRLKVTYLVFVPAPLGGPGLITAAAGERVFPAKEGDVGTLTFPVPGTYRDQVPLAFSLQATPPAALQGYHWRKREDGLNWLCEVKVAPPKEGAVVRWEALVLVGDRPAAELPAAPKPEVPRDAERWLQSTGCVQSADPAVRAKAEELARGTDDVGAYARRVVQFTAQHPLDMRKFLDLSARCALDCGGSCTNRANLCAALLRARGIPARTLAHLPTWSGPLFEHWLVEYWHPGAGWVWLESSLNQVQPSPWTLVALNVANPEDEDKAFQPARTRGVVPGAPYLSVRELSRELLPKLNAATDAAETSNLATPEVRLRGTKQELDDLFAAARQAYAELVRKGEAGTIAPGRAEKLLAAARDGPGPLRRALKGE
jgi:hypothetical protein